jgi:molybdate transport system ATP-binding protein
MVDAQIKAWSERGVIEVEIRHRVGDFLLDASFRATASVVALFGRSGSGKTTLVNALAGISHPDHGRIVVDDVVLFDRERGINIPPERRRVGYVFQDGLLFPHLSVRKNLYYGYRLVAPPERYVDPARVIELLGLEALLERAPSQLSGGEKQRVAIARALLASPRLLLMDEPLASLDAQRKDEILHYVARLRDEIKIPIVYVSHAVEEVVTLADVVVLLTDGKTVAVGGVQEVMARLDLYPYTGRHEAGTLIAARVSAHDHGYQLTTFAFDGGELVVPGIRGELGERTRVRIRARDVAIATERPTHVSVLNVLEGTVAEIDSETGPIAEVKLAIGNAEIRARVTRRAVAQLGLAPGVRAFALVKSVAFDQRSTGFLGSSREIESGRT